jgi:formate-dependent nitrite reductase membrane component NrfD
MTATRLRALLLLLSATGVIVAVRWLLWGDWRIALVLYLLTVATLGLLIAVFARRQIPTARGGRAAEPPWFRAELERDLAECVHDED